MTREQAKKIQPIVQAYADGKTIQYRLYDGSWRDIKDGEGVGGTELAEHPDRYRIKPEPRTYWLKVCADNGGSVDSTIDKALADQWKNQKGGRYNVIQAIEVL